MTTTRQGGKSTRVREHPGEHGTYTKWPRCHRLASRRVESDSIHLTRTKEKSAQPDQPGTEELTFDEVEALHLDGTGRDGDPRFPYTVETLTAAEREHLALLRSQGTAKSDPAAS